MSTAPNPHTLTGALVAGPNVNDEYYDSRTDLGSRVAFEYNAALVTALAGIIERAPNSASCSVLNSAFRSWGSDHNDLT